VAHRKLATVALMDVYERVADVLVETSRCIAGELVVEPGSEEIARMVGASREMVSRVISVMVRRGLVRRQRRKVIIVECDALARLVQKAWA
jgi:CRP/FNR family cyclic AMP-dependent transcriptional regulator